MVSHSGFWILNMTARGVGGVLIRSMEKYQVGLRGFQIISYLR